MDKFVNATLSTCDHGCVGGEAIEAVLGIAIVDTRIGVFVNKTNM